MTRSSTSRTKDRNKDYSPSATADDARPDDSAPTHEPAAPLDPGVGDPVPTMLAERRADAETPRIVRVPDEYAGDRLDKVLAKMFPEFSRSRLQSVDRRAARADRRHAREDPPAGAARRHDHARARSAARTTGVHAGAGAARDRVRRRRARRHQQAGGDGRASGGGQLERHAAERAAVPLWRGGRRPAARGHRASAGQGDVGADGRRAHAGGADASSRGSCRRAR